MSVSVLLVILKKYFSMGAGELVPVTLRLLSNSPDKENFLAESIAIAKKLPSLTNHLPKWGN